MHAKPPPLAPEALSLRLNRSCWVTPFLLLPIFQVMFYAMLYLEPQQVEPHQSDEMSPFARSLAMSALVSIPVLMNLLGVYLLLAYLRMRITVDATHLTSQGVFLRRAIPLADITQVAWPDSSRKAPVLIVQGPQAPIRIGFYEIEEAFPGQCVQQLRDAFPLKVQTGWQEFQKLQNAPPRRAPRLRWLALVNAFLCLLVPGFGILFFAQIAEQFPGLSLFAPTEIDVDRQKLIQTAAFFIAVCAVCVALAVYYVYRYLTFRETPADSKSSI